MEPHEIRVLVKTIQDAGLTTDEVVSAVEAVLIDELPEALLVFPADVLIAVEEWVS